MEYAIETVRRGTIALGMRVDKGVVLAVEEKTRKLQSSGNSQKIFQVDDHLGIAAAGYIPDARVQVDQARVVAQSNRLIYDETVDSESIAKRLADISQQFTQYAGVRPFGVSLIIAGYDKIGASLFLVDPSGTYVPYDAAAIGAGSEQATEYLEKNYRGDMNLEEACVLAVECIYLVSEDKVGTSHLKLAVIGEDKRMKKVQEEEVARFAAKARTRGGTSPQT